MAQRLHLPKKRCRNKRFNDFSEIHCSYCNNRRQPVVTLLKFIPMKILGIESSCDETAAAVVANGNRLLSNVVASSVDLHKAYGGVVPEIAARSHLEVITPVIEEAKQQAGLEWGSIDAIAVTQGPGLGGSLLIGVLTAKSLAMALNKPLYGINHVEAHIYGSFITASRQPGYKLIKGSPALPLLALIISGGHSHLVLMKDHGNYEVLGRTLDDAVGEAFDKVAKMLGLPYPGGPSIAEAAKFGDETAFDFPKAKLTNPYNFSFSGLKTAVLRAAQNAAGHDFTFPSSRLPKALSVPQKADLAASFQRVALETLLVALAGAEHKYKPASVVVCGGVAANQKLRRMAKTAATTPVIFPDIKLCTDNAAMVASCAFYKGSLIQLDPYSMDADPGLSM
jgi:N6-L-threonylcarbamoyladenine synthase